MGRRAAKRHFGVKFGGNFPVERNNGPWDSKTGLIVDAALEWEWENPKKKRHKSFNERIKD